MSDKGSNALGITKLLIHRLFGGLTLIGNDKRAWHPAELRARV